MESLRERRTHTRVKLGRVEISSDTRDSGGFSFTCDAENISVGGVCVNLQQRLELFTGVDVKLYFKDVPDAINCKGKINWTMMLAESEASAGPSYKTGIQFIKLPDSDKLAINKEIKRCLGAALGTGPGAELGAAL